MFGKTEPKPLLEYWPYLIQPRWSSIINHSSIEVLLSWINWMVTPDLPLLEQRRSYAQASQIQHASRIYSLEQISETHRQF